MPTKRRLQNVLDELADDVLSLRSGGTDDEDPISIHIKPKSKATTRTDTMIKSKILSEDEQENEVSLFEIVKAGKNCLQAVVDDWIDSYQKDKTIAVLELAQFFITCSGCRGKITKTMLEKMEPSEIVSKMSSNFGAENSLYPLIQSGVQWKKFKTSFCELIQVLVRQCQNSLIYDQFMMDRIISLLICLTDTPVRAFRHTSTLAAMKLMTALVDVACNVNLQWKNINRQVVSEREKDPKNCSKDRLENLSRKLQELEENVSELNNMIAYIFKGVFVHRYKDTVPTIRGLCLSEAGVWIKKCPEMFLDDSYLKYIGWSLYDKDGEVRLCCMKSLLPLFEQAELLSQLEFFTRVFKDRILQMTMDKETNVAVKAVQLLTCILKYSSASHEIVLSDKDCEQIYCLVYATRHPVAVAAAHFVNLKLFQEAAMASPAKTASGKTRSPNTMFMKDLIQFYIESELNDQAPYLVDSMWGVNKMMKDWECMTDLLLEEPGPQEEGLDDSQETVLIEIMYFCVKQSVTGQSPEGRGPHKKLSTKDINQIKEDKEKITMHFIVTLPELLMKYLMDPGKVTHLLNIVLFLKLKLYIKARQKNSLQLLLENIKTVMERHSSDEVLETGSKCLQYLCSEETSLTSICQIVLRSQVDLFVIKFLRAVDVVFRKETSHIEDDVYSMLSALRRVRAFYLYHDLSSWEIWEDLFLVLSSVSERDDIPEEIVVKTLQSCSMAVIFYYKNLNGKNPDLEEMKNMRLKLGFLMQSFQEYLFHDSDHIKEQAFLVLCDLAIIFSPNIAEDNPLLTPIVFNVDTKLTSYLTEFLLMKVFVEDAEDTVSEAMKHKELTKRRNFLSSFAKLIVYKVIHIKAAAIIFKHYIKYSKEYGDIIKYTLTKARENNKVATSKTLAISLQQMFHELQAEQGDIQCSSPAFQAIKELGKKFALSFGPDAIKNRQAIAAIHIEGILFSLTPLENPDKGPDAAPPNITFLEILCEFTCKLIKQDRKNVLDYLDKMISKSKSHMKSDDWQPFFIYRNGLLQREESSSARRKHLEESSSPESSSETSYDLRTPSPQGLQPLTSTVSRPAYQDVDLSPIIEIESITSE
ncbi:cohesin subunit SA-2 isoform X3 [Biomphalaria glabrata]|nr:cohesin subunit SA-2 isoform X3 [Biomphalaria glabrata]